MFHLSHARMEHLEQAACFSFDDTEAQNIISQETLFGEQRRNYPNEDRKSTMIYLEKKNLRLKWHGIALSEYWRKKQIPRGLRMNKKPSIGKHDPEFLNKWERILNKCSLDLILLIVEQTKKETEKVMSELQELKTEITASDTTQLTKLENEIKEGLTKFEDELKAFKIDKYERDAEDYRKGSVYNWKRRDYTKRTQRPQARGQHTGERRQRQRHREMLLTSEAETSDQGTSASSSTEGSFLESGRGGHTQTYRRRRGGAKGNRDPNRFTRSLNRT